MNRRKLLALLAALGAVPLRLDAQGGCFRGRRIRWLVGWTPGGGYDAYARLVEPLLEQSLGAEVVIDNQPGAAGRVAAVVLSRARADGRTVGILDGPGLLWAASSGEGATPDLEADFTLLARIARPTSVLLASRRSGIRNVAELVAASRQRRLVFGSTAPTSQNFVSAAVMAAALGIDANFVVGYPGSREVLLGLIRGDFDLSPLTGETAIDQIATGAVIPIVTSFPEPSGFPGAADVPSLDGPTGVIRRQAALLPDPARASQLVEALSRYLSAGRLIAAPPRLPDETRRCLVNALQSVLTGEALRTSARRAGRTISAAFGDELRRDISEARKGAASLAPVVNGARRRVR